MNEIEKKFFNETWKIVNEGYHWKENDGKADLTRFVKKLDPVEDSEVFDYSEDDEWVNFKFGLTVDCNNISRTYQYNSALYPQYRTNSNYILDFLLGTNEVCNFFGIEIDGHIWHEKTKEQVIHDKQRERALLKYGFNIIRFSGSEVYRNPSSCIIEMFDIYTKHFYKYIRWQYNYSDFYNGIERVTRSYNGR